MAKEELVLDSFDEPSGPEGIHFGVLQFTTVRSAQWQENMRAQGDSEDLGEHLESWLEGNDLLTPLIAQWDWSPSWDWGCLRYSGGCRAQDDLWISAEAWRRARPEKWVSN